MIASKQRQLILEEAIKKGFILANFPSVAEYYQHLLGVRDIGTNKYGNPFSSPYVAVAGEKIDVSKISSYLENLQRDVRVVDLSATELEDKLADLDREAWIQGQSLKNRAIALTKAAAAEKRRKNSGSSWNFVETFSSTSFIDMNLTTAWIDSSEGIAELPRNGSDVTVRPDHISVISSSIPQGGSVIGSAVSDVFDGLENTQWRVLFTQNDTNASCVAELKTPTDISGIFFDPVGFGLEVTVKADNGDGFTELLRTIIYNKKTFPVTMLGVKRIQITFTSIEVSLPKTAGFRNIILFSSVSSRTASVYSKTLAPTQNYSEILITSDVNLPTGTSVSTYYSTDSGTTWKPVTLDQWHSVTNSSTDSQSFSTEFTSPTGGLFTYNAGGTAVSINEGILEIGLDQIELTATRKDFSTRGEVPHIPTKGDFETGYVLKTWVVPVIRDWPYNLSSNYLQFKNEAAKLYDSTYQLDSGVATIFQTKKSIRSFYDLHIVPFAGSKANNMLQFNHTYKYKFWVFCRQSVRVEDATYWFFQGYRKNSPLHTYKQLGRSYVGFSFYVNDILNVSDDKPMTIWDDNTVESDVGTTMDLTLSEGWNKIEILVHVSDPTFWREENFDNGDPYVQLSFAPSMFDPNFRKAYGITRIVGSGQTKPISEFDLLWSVPRDTSFWAWDSTKTLVKFNSRGILDTGSDTIDGVFGGSYPTCVLSYKSHPTLGGSASALKVRFDMFRDNATSQPQISDYSVSVR